MCTRAAGPPASPPARRRHGQQPRTHNRSRPGAIYRACWAASGLCGAAPPGAAPSALFCSDRDPLGLQPPAHNKKGRPGAVYLCALWLPAGCAVRLRALGSVLRAPASVSRRRAACSAQAAAAGQGPRACALAARCFAMISCSAGRSAGCPKEAGQGPNYMRASRPASPRIEAGATAAPTALKTVGVLQRSPIPPE